MGRSSAGSGSALLALGVAAVLVGAPVAGAAAPAAKVTLAGPARSAAGAGATFTVSIKPAKKQLSKGTLALLLSTDGKRDAKDRKLASRTVKKVKARKTTKVTLRVTVPAGTAPRAYRVLACLTVAKKVTCTARALTVTKAPAPGGPTAPTPLPAPGPAPAPVPTPAPEPEPVVVTTAAPAPGPADAPAADPATQAGTLPAASATSLATATAFLYTGADPIQDGVAPGTITVQRAATLRGRVTNRMDGGIDGVRVTVFEHPEYGRTATRDDGGYDLAVNGGGPLTLVFEREGYIPAQRLVEVPWQDYTEVDPLVLVPYDTRGTRIDTAGTAVEAVRASPVTDAAGTRTQTLLFDPGTTAQMEVNGQLQPLGGEFVVRSTEFTQGENGVAAMPGQLPPNTAYTYAAEFSLDAAAAAGATDIRFSKPVATYLDNFLDLPVGTAVPAGYYDRERAQWVGAPDGRVVKLVAGGVDTDGDGAADNTGIDAAERDKVAALYAAGTELWRVEVSHFTPWDYNYPYGPAGDATGPGPNAGPPRNPPDPDNPCPEDGSIVLCDNQVLGEELAIAGTNERLVYRSDRVPGRLAERTLAIRLRDGALSATLEAIDLRIDVAGRTIKRSFSPAESAATPVYSFTWDGLDGYGRRVQGAQPVQVEIGYRYRAVYQAPGTFNSSWARVSGIPISTNPSRTAISLTKRSGATVTAFDARGEGLGGWTLSDHHAYDPATRTLRLGDGRFGAVTANRIGALETVAPGFDGPTALTTAPDGTVWIADTRAQRIRRLGATGVLSTVAGTGDYGFRPADDGGAATAARLSSPQGIAVVEAGAGKYVAYVADTNANRIRRIAADGKLSTVAGGGTALGDDGPATSARLAGPTGVAVAPDGALYIADTNQHRIRMVGTDGRITTVAGDGTPGASGDGGPASAARLRGPAALAVDSESRLLVADAGNARVRRIGIDGRIETIAGGAFPATGNGDGGLATAARLIEPTGLALARTGELLIADAGDGRVRGVGQDGLIRTLAGGGAEARSEGVPATAVALAAPTGVAVRADQSLLFTEPGADRVARVQEPLPGFTTGDSVIASDDGTELFQFDASGRHLRTLDTLTGAVTRRFAYDDAGRLQAVYDDAAGAAQPHAPLLTIDRADESAPVLRTRGNRATPLALDANGWLASVTNPAAETHALTHDAAGLLRAEEDAEGGDHAFEYDGLGRLTKDTNPDGVVKTLARATLPLGAQVTVTTSGGEVSSYRNEVDGSGNQVRTFTTPAGGVSVSTRRPDGTVNIVFDDGRVLDQRIVPDPRFGLQAAYAASTKVATPGGRTTTETALRTVQMRDPARLEKLVETTTVDGAATVRTFTAQPGDAGGTITLRSPAGRTATTVLDNYGRIASSRLSTGARTVAFVYDDAADGRVASQTAGTRTITYGYDSKQRITSSTDAAARTTTYTYDAADRQTSATLPGGDTWTTTYDHAGRPASYRTPAGRTTTFSPTAGGLDRLMTLPGAEAYSATHTAAGKLAGTTLPTGAGSTSSYDAGGRAAGRTHSRGPTTVTATTFGYAGPTERLASSRWTSGATQQDTTQSYDGDLPTGITAAGPAAGTFTYTPAAVGLQIASIRVTAGAGAPRDYIVARDADRLVTSFGPFSITRDADSGRAKTYTDTADATVVEVADTEGYGENDTRTVRKGATTAYALDVDRDATGRIARREESIAGGPAIARVYVHDPQGRLIRVENGTGTTLEEYVYDADGNRTSARSENHAAETSTYDARGTQTAVGARPLSFDADGRLTSRGADAIDYAPGGELLHAAAGAASVSYAYDGLRRLVSRASGTDKSAFLYGNPDNPFEVTATTDEANVLTTYFYDETDTLHALERGGTRFRVGVDQVGTPRVVVDASGAVVKRVDRDTFGRVLADSAPAFELPIGFAGGIEDPTTGLVRFGQRDYDPETGRWTTRDPAMYAGSPRNLYVYVENVPDGRRDPTGLLSIGGSAYVGIGGGGSVNVDGGGFGFCLEVGVGAGAGAEVDLLGKAENSIVAVTELSASSGALGTSISVERDPCKIDDPDKVTGKFQYGAGSVAVDSVNGLSGASASTGIKADLQGKAAIKQCWAWTWW